MDQFPTEVVAIVPTHCTPRIGTGRNLRTFAFPRLTPSTNSKGKGFRTLRANNYTANADEDVRDFRLSVPDGMKNKIKSMLFGGFDKCLYRIQKFDSDSERRFAIVLENDANVVKWVKPAKGAVLGVGYP